ncbi:DNA helicase rad5 [Cryptotrichosporon argae]
MPSSESDLFFPASDSEPESDGVPDVASPPPFVPSAAAPSSSHAKYRREASDEIVALPASSSRHPSAPQTPTALAAGGFLGEFVCEGWSLSKGKGYCSPGSAVLFERPKPRPAKTAAAAEKSGPTRLEGGRVVPAKTAKGKQMTLGAMMKKPPPAPATKKTTTKQVDQIIRFRNDRGFEVGRLSVKQAGFLVHLIDADAIELRGTVIDCPQVLSTGSTILLNVRVYLTSQAFFKAPSLDRQAQGTFWQEQKETGEEEAMRHRKEALQDLFSRISIKPLRSNALGMAQNPAPTPVKPSPSAKTPSSAAKPKNGASAKEEDDDSEEDSGDEAEKLDERQLNELDSIYRKAQMGDAQLEETDPPDTFLYTLRPYQKQALTWMKSREAGDSHLRDSNNTLHPLWEEYAFKKEQQPGEPIEIEDDEDIADDRKFYYNPYSGELSREFPRSQNLSRGGILADAMGMGKTCMMSSLIHASRDSDPVMEDFAQTVDTEPASKRRKFVQVTLSNQWRATAGAPAPPTAPRATLVVCPVSLAAQWADELGKMSAPGSINATVWYGNDRTDFGLLMGQEGKRRVDVIVTSYGTLASEFQKWRRVKDKPAYEGGNIYDYEFLRVVLDEAHNIKNRTALVSKACYKLKGQRRWALTGTPIVNRLDDLYSLLHYLGIEPWGSYSFFRSFVTLPFLNQDPKALNVVQYILESCLLRREKTMRDKDGRLIVDLPPKTLDVQVLRFSRPERQIYKQLEDSAKRKFIQLDAEGRAMSNYTSILAMLMKLRQCVDHPLLVIGKGSDDDKAGNDMLRVGGDETTDLKKLITSYASGNDDSAEDGGFALQVLRDLEATESAPECVICASEIFDEVLLPCYHRGCQDCVVDWIGHCEDGGKVATCPVCDKGPLLASDLRSVQRRQRRINPITGTYIDADGKPASQNDGAGTAITIGKVDLVSSTKLRALSRKLQAVRTEDPTYKALVFSQFTSFLDLIETTLNKEGVRWLRFDGSMSQAQRAATIDEFGKKVNEPVVLLISLKAGGVGLNLTMANYVFMMDTWWNEAIEQQAIDRVHRLGQERPVFVTRYIIKGTVEKRILKIQRTKTALVNASLAGGVQKDKQASLADIKKIFGLDDDDSEDEAY